jgi:hypothetical protein
LLGLEALGRQSIDHGRAGLQVGSLIVPWGRRRGSTNQSARGQVLHELLLTVGEMWTDRWITLDQIVRSCFRFPRRVRSFEAKARGEYRSERTQSA